MPEQKKTTTLTFQLNDKNLRVLKLVLASIEDLFTINTLFNESCAKLDKEGIKQLKGFMRKINISIAEQELKN